MKRLLCLFIVCALFLAACGGGDTGTIIPDPASPAELTTPQATPEVEEAELLRVIATVFPQYDFVRQIAGDRVELSMLISPGAEPHAFEPTPRDIIALDEADLFIYVGGHEDAWLEAILASLANQTLYRVALVDLVETLEVGHDHDHDHGHSHGHDHGHSHSHTHAHSHDHDDDCDDEECDDPAHSHDHDEDCDDEECDDPDHHHHHHDVDEHVWTSPRNAILIVQALTDVLVELDAANAEFFRANAAAYIAELEALDAAFAEVVEEAVRHTVVFGDRFPFLYLMEAYGLHAYAAFVGCGSETQATPTTIAMLIEKVQAEEIPVVFYIEFSTQLIANVIQEATGARLLELHSAHNVSAADFAAGVTYLDLMWQNLEHLREALS